MIIITGGAGFIGSNLVHQFNATGRTDIIVVDDLTDGKRCENLAQATIEDYWDKEEFIKAIRQGVWRSEKIEAIFHQGANSTTTDWDGKAMMANNFTYSKDLLHFAQQEGIPFIYASSAAVYGTGTVFKESPDHECPLNVYGYSKLAFDQYVRRYLPHATSQIVGLRYFNVYGPREQHKGSMASVPFHWYHQARRSGTIQLFEGCEGYGDGEQRRDFVFVNDIVAVNRWFLTQPQLSGIFNVGTGESRSFNDLATAIQKRMSVDIRYIPFPAHLVGYYQSFTEADISTLRQAGYDQPFLSVDEGVAQYLTWLDRH